MSIFNKSHENRLAREVSPYLLQHKSNPVEWWPWCDEALECAKKENKPILLSIGYSSCHWCHIMAHESFDDAETADIMNKSLINIKVDKEERPDLDAIYMNAIHFMGLNGGWPLTIFLTPDGKPFFGGAYFPKEARFGLPSFKDILQMVNKLWKFQQADLESYKDKLFSCFKKEFIRDIPKPKKNLKQSTFQAASNLLYISDLIYGGIKGYPKFPQPLIWEFLWWHAMYLNRDDMKNAVITLADNLCNGGIYDHIGGGWFRYSVDEIWMVPHFEKMQYDNALIIDLLTTIWKKTKNPLYEKRMTETINWLNREMVSSPDKKGRQAFTSSIDADSEGKEGKFYIWESSEINKILGEDSALFKGVFGVKEEGNWEGSNILYALGYKDTELLQKCKAKLFQAREQRVKPEKDDKILADWNGLTITALVRAALAFAKPEWLELAADCYNFIRSKMLVNNYLYHSYCKGILKQDGFLEDYADLALAASHLYSALGEKRYLSDCIKLTLKADELFLDKSMGNYFKTSKHEKLIIRLKEMQDGITPMGNGIMAKVFIELHYHTGKQKYFNRAEEIINSTYNPQIDLYLASSIVMAKELLNNAIHVCLVGVDSLSDQLFSVVAKFPNPNIIIQRVNNTEELAIKLKNLITTWDNVTPSAYICCNGICYPPIQDPLKLEELLKSF